MSPTRVIDRHESWQEPGTEQQWSDSFYFGAGDGRGLAFYSRIGRRPNEQITEAALGAWLPGQGFLLSFARIPSAGVSVIEVGPLSFDCLLPLVTWEIRFEGEGRLFERAEHVATDRGAYRQVPAVATLRFTAWGDPLSFESGLAAGVATDHYEQPGSGGHPGRRGAPPSPCRPRDARPLLGGARLATGSVLALVRDGRGP